MSDDIPVTMEDYERTKRHPIWGDPATQAHIEVSRWLTIYGTEPTTGNRGELLRAIHHYADLVHEARVAEKEALVSAKSGGAAAGRPSDEARAFEYLLNAMERAAWEDNPADHGYAAKRKAVFAYVADLRAALASAEQRARTQGRVGDWTALQAFGFALMAAGGTVRVPRSLVAGFDTDGWELHRWYDPYAGDTVFTMRRAGAAPTEGRGSDSA